MEKQKDRRKSDEPVIDPIKQRLRKKYPQLTDKGVIPYFSRFQVRELDDEEFTYLATCGVNINVNQRTLNYINERCKKLGIISEIKDGLLHVKNRSGK